MLDHQFMGLENLIKGRAERYVVADLEEGIHVAHSFKMMLRYGHVTALAKMQRAVKFHGYGYDPSREEVLARADIRVNFQPDRTEALVKVALGHQCQPDRSKDPAPTAFRNEQEPTKTRRHSTGREFP